MSKAAAPELKTYMDKRLFIQLNGDRKVTGILRGFDSFMNLVLEDTVEEVSQTDKKEIGSVVIRGNSVVVMEAIDKI
ncbi:ribonucleoprotein LSM domain-containing protein [Phlyctochytrium arcticum]|nr:ribonucleoprotein LSM domain-containing protein [Phlyctochytrium arcticum]